MSFELREGEVLGVAGLQGHGQRELFMALFGAERAEGQIEVWGKPVTIRGPRPRAVHADRHGAAARGPPQPGHAARQAGSREYRSERAQAHRQARLGRSSAKQKRLVDGAVAQLRIKTDSIEQPAGTLSGGNQQKVVLAKLLATEARILLFFDPTRGVDVGTKAEIFALMRDLASRGFAILFFSTDLSRTRQCRRPHAGDELRHGSPPTLERRRR